MNDLLKELVEIFQPSLHWSFIIQKLLNAEKIILLLQRRRLFGCICGKGRENLLWLCQLS